MTAEEKFSNKQDTPSVEGDGSAWAWSKFWRDDNLSACTPDDDTTDGLLQQEWRLFFRSLNDKASILDLGTGNGALAVIAVSAETDEVGDSRSFDVHGCDLAAIEPSLYVKSHAEDLVQIQFHAETAMEKLPFADATYDAVCGQYALEYSNVSESVPELMRVLRSGGSLQFLLHDAAGALHQRNQLQWQQAQTLLESELVAGTRNMLTAVVAGESASQPGTLEEGMRAIAGLKGIMDRLAKELSGDTDRVLPERVFAAISRLAPLRHGYDVPQLLSLVDDIEQRLHAQGTRLRAMLDAALDVDSLQRLSALFTSAGAEDVRTRPAMAGANETRVGYWLSATKK
jgi:ubiquinone/menaquinone biosynthesis C-methylase UbiE